MIPYLHCKEQTKEFLQREINTFVMKLENLQTNWEVDLSKVVHYTVALELSRRILRNLEEN